jgi:hypothetical protein
MARAVTAIHQKVILTVLDELKKKISQLYMCSLVLEDTNFNIKAMTSRQRVTLSNGHTRNKLFDKKKRAS